MGMRAVLRRTTAEELAWLLADVDARFAEVSGVEPEDDDAYERFYAPELVLDVDKAWDSTHRVLVAAAARDAALAPVTEAVLGGTPAGEDLGYGPLRYLTPAEVEPVAAALARLDDEALAAAAESADFDGCYSFEPEWRDEPVEMVRELRTFYAAVAAAGDGLLLELG
jgi:hypothetical protein